MNAYSIAAPEDIAKKYGGNKKKIQQAASQGLISPTEAVMAGMFIDRIRNAAQAEQAQQPTVAEQVMNPQPQMPPQGMAAMPQAQQMPPQAQMGQPQMPPQQMAMGGGLDSIPYNEGDYAAGGIVSFAPGGGYGEVMSQLRRQLGAARTQAQRDQITAAMNQLRAQQEGSTYQPALAAADLSIPAMDTETGFSGAVESPRIDPDRFNTGTLTEAEARRIEGRDMMDNVERGFGMFTDFVKRKLPSFGEVEKLTDPETDMLSSSAESLPVEQDRINPSGGNRFDTGTFTEEEARRIAKERGGVDQKGGLAQIVSPDDAMFMGADASKAINYPTVQTAPMVSRQIPTSLGPKVGRGGDPREFGETPEERLAYRQSQIQPQGLNAIAKPMTADEAIAALGERKGTGANETFVQAPTVEEQVKKTQETAKQIQDPFVGLETVVEPEPAGTPAERNKQMIGADETVDQYVNRMMGQLPKEAEGALTKKLKDRIANQAENMKGAKKDAMWMAVLETGVGMLAQGGGQTMFQALGKAAGPALKNYASAIKDIKAEDLDLLKHGVAMEAADKKAKAEITKQLVANFGAERTAQINRESQERVSDARNKVLLQGYRIQAEAQNLDKTGLAALIAKDREARGMPALTKTELIGLAELTLQQNKNYRAQQQALVARMPGLQQEANIKAQEAVDNFTQIQVGAGNPQRTRYDELDQKLRAEKDPAKQAQIRSEMNAILEGVRTKARAQAMEGVMGQINQAPSPLIIGTGADGSPIGSNPDVLAAMQRGNY